MRRLARSIQARVLMLVLAAAGVLWLVVAALTWIDTRHELDELLDAHLAQSAELLVAQLPPDTEDEERSDAPLRHRYSPRVVFQVFHEGRLALRSGSAPETPIAPLDGIEDHEFRTVRLQGESWRVFATRGARNDVLVLVAENAHSRDGILAAILRTTLGPLMLGLPLLALALWWSVRRGLRPVNDIRHALASRAPDDLSSLPREGAPMELQPMLDALDNLFARTASLMQAERRFTADAAHELRTPLAAIRAQAQVALGAPDPEARRHALQATLEGCKRAARLVDQLLALSRLDAQAVVGRELVDLRVVTREVLGTLGPAAIAKQQDLAFDAPAEPCEVRGDAMLLAVLVRNLADNAVRYAPPGGRIRVAVRHDGAGPLLTVEDSGAAPAEGDMGRLGERFFRVLGTDVSGSGLGLSIVRRIAQLHGAEVTFSRSALGGFGVQVRFPRS